MMAWLKDRLTKAQAWFLLIGVLAFVTCLGLSLYEERPSNRPEVNEQSCRQEIAPSLVSITPADENGQLRFIGFWPAKFALNQRLCVAVAGVASEAVAKRLADELESSKRELSAVDEEYRKASDQEKEFKTKASDADAKSRREPANNELKAAATNARDELIKKTADVKEQDEKRKRAQQKVSDALIAAAAGLPPVELTLYLDNRRVPGVSVKAQPVSTLQYLFFDFRPSAQADTDEAKFWRTLFGLSLSSGTRVVSIGLSRATGAADIPQATVKDNTSKDKLATLVVFRWSALGMGIVALVFLVVWLASFGATSTLLRDGPLSAGDVLDVKLKQAVSDVEAAEKDLNAKKNAQPALPKSDVDAAELALKNAQARKDELEQERKDLGAIGANKPVGTFSLGRVQMAVWFVLSLAGFCFIWLITGQFINVITAQILVLLGIQAATGLAAVQLNDEAAAKRTTRGFLLDILSDGEGVKLQRLQVVAWTCILAIIFAWTIVSSFSFPAFDANLLLLMGIFNSTYLGFKYAQR